MNYCVATSGGLRKAQRSLRKWIVPMFIMTNSSLAALSAYQHADSPLGNPVEGIGKSLARTV